MRQPEILAAVLARSVAGLGGTSYHLLDHADLRGQVTTAIKREFNRIAALRQTAGDEDEDDDRKYVIQVNRSLGKASRDAAERYGQCSHRLPLPPLDQVRKQYQVRQQCCQ